MKGALATAGRWVLMWPLVFGPRALWRFAWPAVRLFRIESWVYAPMALALAGVIFWFNVAEPAGFRPTNLDALFSAVRFWPRWARLVAALASLPLVSLLFLAPLHVAMLRLPMGRAKKNSHGSAAWGTTRQAREGGFIQEKDSAPGFVLGRMKPYAGANDDHRFRVRGSHVATFCRTGGGKGIGCVVPNLLLWPGSAFVLDVKGTSYAITAEARKGAGQAVARIDPFGVTGKPTHRVNWLSGLDVDSEAVVRESAKLADALVVRGGGEDSHWDDSAAAFLQGLILYVASLPLEEAHPGTVRQILTLPADQLTQTLRVMACSEAAFGLVARAANGFLARADRERSGVLSTAQRHTQFLDDPAIVDACRKTDFDFAAMKRGKLTAYLIIPFELLKPYSRFVRVLMAGALQRLMAERTIPEHDVLFLLDEFARLGRFDVMEEMLPMLRDYRVRVWMLFQDLAQLKANYPRLWASFLANSVAQFFGVQDSETSRYVSQALGNSTVRIEAGSRSTSAGGKHQSQGSARSEQFHGRPLLTPDEVTRLPADQAVVFVPAQPPYRLTRLNYLTDPETAGMARPDPMHVAAKPVGLATAVSERRAS